MIDNRLKYKIQGIPCKLDIERAFDNVNWHCLDSILESSGFGGKWRQWIGWWLSAAQSSVLVNGSATPQFNHQKGLRKEDSLSSIVFILVA